METKPPSSWKVFSYRQIIFVIRIPSKHYARHSSDHVGRRESKKYIQKSKFLHLPFFLLEIFIFLRLRIHISDSLAAQHNINQVPHHLQCTIRKAKTHGNEFYFFKEFYKENYLFKLEMKAIYMLPLCLW